MRLRRVALLAASALVAASLAGCVTGIPVGPIATDSPEIADATAVELKTSGDLTITEGEPSLTITAPEGVLDRLTAEVEDGVLVLGHRGGPLLYAGVIRYELTLPTLDTLIVSGTGDVDATVSGESLTIEISGAGDVEVTGIAASDVTAEISGAGDLELAGETGSLTVEISGAGDVDADDLTAAVATVEVSGAGDADVHVTGTLDVEISGLGSVHHSGGATVRSEISGLGDLESDD